MAIKSKLLPLFMFLYLVCLSLVLPQSGSIENNYTNSDSFGKSETLYTTLKQLLKNVIVLLLQLEIKQRISIQSKIWK